MLGMHAHINRDLPVVLAATGLVMPDGSSGKADYDKVEEFLHDASEAKVAGGSEVPTLDDANDPLSAVYGTIFQIISAARAVVSASIELEANAAAQVIVLALSYLPW